MRQLFVMVLCAATLGAPSAASAFCGFYVSGADASLYNNATMVVLMRDGTKTILSMQNSYQGPPEDFAMVVPVPVVLDEDTVKTLPREVFNRVDQLAAPRLVEYWEQDPCFMPRPRPMNGRGLRRRTARPSAARGAMPDDFGVTIEAEFQVAEYDIVILSARDSSGLDTWLRLNQYNIPRGAERVLGPYVEAGTKFFVAKVDVERVTFTEGRAVLSPLRFHYDHDEFSLPVRLGLLNSGGRQDLLVHVLARSQRYEVANYPNVTIPTNLRVVDAVRTEFGPWYDLLFRRAVASNPGSVVTEYAWDASSCDPCPTTPLQPAEINVLGGDVVGVQHGFVLTRLHYRYGREGLDEDLVFRAAPPIVGGRGTPDVEGQLTEEGAQAGHINNFQGRYVILHPWEGPITCENPRRGRWGGPPGGAQQTPVPASNPATVPAAARSVPTLTAVGLGLNEDVPALGLSAGVAEALLDADPGPAGGPPEPYEGDLEDGPAPQGLLVQAPPTAPAEGGCASCAVGAPGSRGWQAGVALLGLLAIVWRRRR